MITRCSTPPTPTHRTDHATSRPLLTSHNRMAQAHCRTTRLSEQLRRNYGDAAAIDMESGGVYLAGHLNHRLPVLTVRGISDLADGAKSVMDSMGWQAVAAGNAAALGLAIAADLCSEKRRTGSAAGPALPRRQESPRAPGTN